MIIGDIHEYYEAVAQKVCPTTRNGWVWYCDPHDTHGTSDSKGEANTTAAAHEVYKEIVDGDEQECDIWIVEITGTVTVDPGDV